MLLALLAAVGCCLGPVVVLGATWCCWALLGAAGRWVLENVVGQCWVLLGAVGCCWALLGVDAPLGILGYCKVLLGTVGRYCVLLRGCWVLLATVGHCWVLLGIVECCIQLL